MVTTSAPGAEQPGRTWQAGAVDTWTPLDPSQHRNRPCPCGSGKRFKHCCGDLEPPRVSATLTKELLEEQLSSLLRARDEGDWSQVEQGCHALLDQVPNQVQALRLLIEAKRQRNDPDAAWVLLQRLLRYFPHSSEAAAGLGEFYEWKGVPAEADAAYQKAVRLDPANCGAHIALGRLAQRLGNFGNAEVHLREAHYLDSGNAQVTADLGRVLSGMGRKAESEHFFRLSLSQDPDEAQALLAWASMEESRGDLTRAWQLVRQVREQAPDLPLLPLAEAVLQLREKDYRQALESLKRTPRERLSLPAMSHYYFTRGRVLDALERYDDAFESFRRANAINTEQMGMRYDPERHAQFAQRLKAYFTRERVAGLPKAQPRSDDTNPRPVFLVSFPRSGAALVEQMLGMHCNIVAGDEIHTVPDLRSRTPAMLGAGQAYPECLDALQQRPEAAYRLRDEYLAAVRLAGILEPGADRFTDKLPLNEWNLGLINVMFPDADIVHVVRHPLDAVLSSFCNDIRHGELCCFNLVHAARHYALTLELVEHFCSELDLHVTRVRYEDLVSAPEQTCRGLLDFLGQEWEPRCLEFHQSRRHIRGPSYAQLREPLNTTSVMRHRRYTAHLKPITAILQPAVEILGYEGAGA